MQLRELGMLVLLAAIWGASYLFLRVAAPVLGALVLIDARVLLAGVVLWVYALALGRAPALRARWRSVVWLGVINAALPFVLIASATVYLHASFAVIVNATTPIFTAIVAAVWLQEPFTWRKVLGLCLGIVGVSVLVGWTPLALNPMVVGAIIMALTGALCYGIGGVYTRVAFKGMMPLDLAIGQQLAAGMTLLPFAAWVMPTTMPDLNVLGALLGLSLLSTAFAYLIYFELIARVGPTKTLSVTFLSPCFGILWGVLFLGEPIYISMWLGLAIILMGVLLITEVQLPRAILCAISSHNKNEA